MECITLAGMEPALRYGQVSVKWRFPLRQVGLYIQSYVATTTTTTNEENNLVKN